MAFSLPSSSDISLLRLFVCFRLMGFGSPWHLFISTIFSLIRERFVRLSPVRHTHAGQVPESLLYGENHLGGCPDFLSYSSPHILSAGMRGGESYHTFLDGLAMEFDELQTGNSSEALVPSV